MWLLVGLGNPGPTYQRTRHNVGFLVVDAWADRHGADPWRARFGGLMARAKTGDQEVLLVKPQSFMNLSGRVVGPAAGFFKVPLERIIVIHDEADLPFGTLRLKAGGGHGGHNGLRSLTADLGGNGFLRLRMGIGRRDGGDLAGYVLGAFGGDERAELPGLIETATGAVDVILADGIGAAMNRFNGRVRGEGAGQPGEPD
jgi:peptidyl-tRNA hydrolase, PTH1 family